MKTDIKRGMENASRTVSMPLICLIDAIVTYSKRGVGDAVDASCYEVFEQN
jgi:hypothetical protein